MLRLLVGRVLIVVVAIAVALAACSPAVAPPSPPPAEMMTAPLMVELTPQELAAQASHIILGRVMQTRSQWNADRSHISTLVTLSVDDRIKGDGKEQQIVIQVPGGSVGKLSEVVEDSPGFVVGEQVLVFLIKQGATFSVVGGIQGKFVIENGRVAGSNQSLDEFIHQITGRPGMGRAGTGEGVLPPGR